MLRSACNSSIQLPKLRVASSSLVARFTHEPAQIGPRLRRRAIATDSERPRRGSVDVVRHACTMRVMRPPKPPAPPESEPRPAVPAADAGTDASAQGALKATVRGASPPKRPPLPPESG